MPETRAQRTLVKSPPELWAEVSDAAALARLLGSFGEIRITRLEPETAVAWEGDTARGTVELEPSGWGTKVTLTADAEDRPVPALEQPEALVPEAPAPAPEHQGHEQEPEPEADTPEPEAAEPAPEAEAAPEPAPRPGFFARLFGRRRPAPEPQPSAQAEPEPTPQPAPTAEPEPVAPPEIEPEITAAEPQPEPRAAEPEPPAPSLEQALETILDDLGSARHRPFSRA